MKLLKKRSTKMLNFRLLPASLLQNQYGKGLDIYILLRCQYGEI